MLKWLNRLERTTRRAEEWLPTIQLSSKDTQGSSEGWFREGITPASDCRMAAELGGYTQGISWK